MCGSNRKAADRKAAAHWQTSDAEEFEQEPIKGSAHYGDAGRTLSTPRAYRATHYFIAEAFANAPSNGL
jgi:hypothetical protein